MSLPFWDDFSLYSKVRDSLKWAVAADTLWNSRSSVRISDGIGINPRSIGVATFEGLDSTNRPHNSKDLISNGFGDSLVSRRLRLGDVITSNRDSVYFSFAYQWKGNGEAPDPADYLQIDFLNNKKKWITVGVINSTGTYNPELFYDFIVKVSGEDFFHNDFQFRIMSYGRQSGPFDTWLVDYIFLHEHRFENDLSFTDRSMATQLPLIWAPYYSLPKDHFFSAPFIKAPVFSVANLKDGPTVLQYKSSFKTKNYKGNSVIISGDTLNNKKQLPNSLNNFQRVEVTMDKMPLVTNLAFFNPLSDSIDLTLQAILLSGDNVPIGTAPNADYKPFKYNPINFHSNDTIHSFYRLSDYYAFDDGVAEYSVNQSQPGNLAAMRFSQLTDQTDTITGVYIYFPQLAGNVSNSMDLLIYENDNGLPGKLLADESVAVRRLGLDKFYKIRLRNGVLVPQEFFIGWREPLNGTVGIGLDKAIDNSDKIVIKAKDTWQPSTGIKGTLMIRPIFGDGSVNTGIEAKENELTLFPNPTSSGFAINQSVKIISIVSITGQEIPFEINLMDTNTHVYLISSYTGIAIVTFQFNGQTIRRKLLIN